jgi:hypothetical protein
MEDIFVEKDFRSTVEFQIREHEDRNNVRHSSEITTLILFHPIATELGG